MTADGCRQLHYGVLVRKGRIEMRGTTLLLGNSATLLRTSYGNDKKRRVMNQLKEALRLRLIYDMLSPPLEGEGH